MNFSKFNSLHRWSREVVVTEKIDGTNASIQISDDGEFRAGARNGFITPEQDNFGFAAWAQEHKDDLMQLGPGAHFGEWWGSSIQRRYGLKEKRFSLFNTSRWEVFRPQCCGIVPVLWRGNMDTLDVYELMNVLKNSGSQAAPGFMNPEGIVIWHSGTNISLKKTFEGDENGKTRS